MAAKKQDRTHLIHNSHLRLSNYMIDFLSCDNCLCDGRDYINKSNQFQNISYIISVY